MNWLWTGILVAVLVVGWLPPCYAQPSEIRESALSCRKLSDNRWHKFTVDTFSDTEIARILASRLCGTQAIEIASIHLRRIDASTASFVDNYFKALGRGLIRRPAVATLESEGGIGRHGMYIGFLFRHHQTPVVIPRGGFCYSACVYAFAGAVSRQAYGPVGVHMPRIPAGERLPEGQYRILLDGALKADEDYYRQMGVSSRIVDRIRATPHHDMYVLEQQELLDLGLGPKARFPD